MFKVRFTDDEVQLLKKYPELSNAIATGLMTATEFCKGIHADLSKRDDDDKPYEPRCWSL